VFFYRFISAHHGDDAAASPSLLLMSRAEVFRGRDDF